MSKKIIYHNRMQFTKRGDEIDIEQLEPEKIYAVNYCLKKETAEKRNTYQQQWGIIVLNEDKEIVNSYNVLEPDAISTKTGSLSKNLHVFLPTRLEEIAMSSSMAASHALEKNLDLEDEALRLTRKNVELEVTKERLRQHIAELLHEKYERNWFHVLKEKIRKWLS